MQDQVLVDARFMSKYNIWNLLQSHSQVVSLVVFTPEVISIQHKWSYLQNKSNSLEDLNPSLIIIAGFKFFMEKASRKPSCDQLSFSSFIVNCLVNLLIKVDLE